MRYLRRYSQALHTEAKSKHIKNNLIKEMIMVYHLQWIMITHGSLVTHYHTF